MKNNTNKKGINCLNSYYYTFKSLCVLSFLRTISFKKDVRVG